MINYTGISFVCLIWYGMHYLSYVRFIQFQLSERHPQVPISLLQDMDSYDI